MALDKGRIIAIAATLLIIGVGTFPYWKDHLPTGQPSLDDRIAEAKSYCEKHEPKKSLELCETLLGANIKDSAQLQKVLLVQGFDYLQLQQWEKAEDSLAAAADCQPPNAQVFAAYGESLLRQRAFKEAIEQFSEAIKIDPTLWEPYWRRGKAREGTGELLTAALDYRKASELKPDNADVALDLIKTLGKQKDWDATLWAIEGALERFPNNKEIKDLERPIAQRSFWTLRAEHLAHPNDALPYADAAFAMYHNGAYPDAIMACNRAIELSGGRIPLAWRVRADAEYELGKKEEAKKDYAKALELDPKSEITRRHAERIK